MMLLFIIQLFYCSSANYMILTMFQNNLDTLPLFPTFQKQPKEKNSQKGPFIFEKMDKRQKQSEKNVKKWSTDCHLRYIACLRSFKRQEWELQGRRSWLPFRKMAHFIKFRNINQCRIHHRKMLEQHHSIQGIIAANCHLIRLKKLTFGRYIHQLASITNIQEICQDGTNERGRMLKSLIIDQHKQVAQHQSEQCGQGGYDEEKKGEDFIPTDIAYPQQKNIQPIDHRKTRGYLQFFSQMPSQRAFPSKQQLSQQKKREWQQCHQLFLAWTSKLQSLLS